MANENNLPQDDNLSADPNHVAGEMADADGETTDPNMTATGAPQPAASRTDAELADLKDKYLRLAAEFENYKRRTTKERIELFKTANQELMTALLPVLDDFDRARAATASTTDAGAVRESIDIIQNKLNKTLQQKGLTQMEAKGGDFDAELHEAITQIPAPSDDLKGKIVDVVEQGYYLGDKVIRHAKVVLGQ
ncbi:nucleotide exchange factor GrpE [Hymenobacter properus]|uniref:Protein GrpE n=1 Tax=Hymenobacter properus TaxID=2791026 RepID=A0A931FMT4_9BACT|nr:nucleotide exchange factor GrpE [Hymenobacter properus]MBF9143416.1 nucleotide exchange factor GrpE [Hymenobacter properus]MBR7722229.1 nucleotide exchange factor GrpE [Microvirga sp. SRT04]